MYCVYLSIVYCIQCNHLSPLHCYHSGLSPYYLSPRLFQWPLLQIVIRLSFLTPLVALLTLGEVGKLKATFPRAHCNLLLLFCCQVVSSYFSTPWTIVHQGPLSMRFPRQEYWTGLPFPSPGDLPKPGMEPELAGGFFTTEPPGNPPIAIRVYQLVPDNNHTHKIQKVGNGIIFLMMWMLASKGKQTGLFWRLDSGSLFLPRCLHQLHGCESQFGV